MRKGRDGEKKKKRKKNGGEKKRRIKKEATMSLPAVNRPNADRCNAARSRQFSAKYNSLDKTFHMIREKILPILAQF